MPFVLHELCQDGPEVTARYRIHPCCRLVENGEFRFVNQRADQTQLLLHAAGQMLHGSITKCVESRHGQ